MHVDEAIRTRKSVRRFLTDPVPASVVRHILEVSARAPSGNNVQPWRVYAVAGDAKARVCDAIMQAATSDPDRHQPEYAYYPTQWVEPYLDRRRRCGFGLYATLGIARDDAEARHRQMLRNYVFFDAPVGLFVTLDRRLNTGSYMDLGMFIQNIMVAARAQGLHTCAQAAFAWFHDVVRRQLPLSEHEVLACGIALGREDVTAPENAFITERAQPEEFAHFAGFESTA
jgi:nitroreductase